MSLLRADKFLANETWEHVMSAVRQLPKLTDLDEAELRAFYESFGMSAETIDNAIKARRKAPMVEGPSALAGKRKRGRHAVKAFSVTAARALPLPRAR